MIIGVLIQTKKNKTNIFSNHATLHYLHDYYITSNYCINNNKRGRYQPKSNQSLFICKITKPKITKEREPQRFANFGLHARVVCVTSPGDRDAGMALQLQLLIPRKNMEILKNNKLTVKPATPINV